MKRAPLILLLWSARAAASGLDLPTLYSARHAALGGAAVGYVDDPSALFHNPAGLLGVERLSLLVDVSTFVGTLESNPGYANQDASTGAAVAPVPMFGLGYRLSSRIALGLAAYPSGAAGGEFHYVNSAGVRTIDSLSALLVEVTPGISVEVLPTLRVGLGYRLTFLRFARISGAEENPTKVNVDLLGSNAAGLRAGVQWQVLPRLSLGAAYRHRVDLVASAGSGTLLGAQAKNIDATLTVPAKLSAGTRFDAGRLGLVADVEYIFNSQNQSLQMTAQLPSQNSMLDVPFVFRWDDSIVVKAGAEWYVRPQLAARIGYAFDGHATNRHFPSAFTSPPVDAHYATAGLGWQAGSSRFDVAGVYRFNTSTYIAQREIADSSMCPFCGNEGTYAASAAAIMIDYATQFGW
jgi:long-chain fatty acid transport protein